MDDENKDKTINNSNNSSEKDGSDGSDSEPSLDNYENDLLVKLLPNLPKKQKICKNIMYILTLKLKLNKN
jgi:hypothetical protein